MKELSRVYSAIEPSPDFIKEAAIAAIRNGQTKYTPAAGTNDVRQAVAYRIKEDFGVDYDWSSIIVSSGAKACLFAVFSVLINPGDEVILPAPFWVSYSAQIKMCGGVPVSVFAPESQSFKITPEQLEAAITDKTKAFVINNPSNPTGMIYNREELLALAEVCVRHDLYIVSDEIYYRLCYDGAEFVSVASLGEDIKKHTILINGVSKSYAMTGWRCGYAAFGDKNMAKITANALSQALGGIGTMNQVAMAAALRGPQDSVEVMRRVFQERRDYMVSRINAIEGVSCIKPNGAFYVMMNIEDQIGRTLGGHEIRTASDFSMAFLEKRVWSRWLPATRSASIILSAGPMPPPWRISKRDWIGLKSS